MCEKFSRIKIFHGWGQNPRKPQKFYSAKLSSCTVYTYILVYWHKHHIKGSVHEILPVIYVWLYVCEHFEPSYADSQPHYFFPFSSQKKSLRDTELHCLYTVLPAVSTQLWKQVCCSIATVHLWPQAVEKIPFYCIAIFVIQTMPWHSFVTLCLVCGDFYMKHKQLGESGDMLPREI